MTRVDSSPGVSFVVPVRNGRPFLDTTLLSIRAQCVGPAHLHAVGASPGKPFEIIVVEDGSDDGSDRVLQRFGADFELRIMAGAQRGAAAALNAGCRAARFPIVCQIDQDVELHPGWLTAILGVFDDPDVGAAQGCFVTDRSAGLFARITALDLEHRYSALGGDTDHVCTGNTAYRSAALERVGWFDETLGYGYDNDVSYRLCAAGYRLRHCEDARSLHRWREGLAGYMAQQYGFGYGRLDLLRKHPNRVSGDRVSPAMMMAHPLILAVALGAIAVFAAAAAMGHATPRLLVAGISLIAALALERFVAGVRAAWRFRDAAALGFPIVHLLRDAAWITAIAVWLARRASGRRSEPRHSMRPRSPGRTAAPP